MVEYLEGNEVAYVRDNPHKQVYKATHVFPTSPNTASWERQKYMYRSFISFSFGGKNIEDWNLIAVTDGDRLQRLGHASFEDLTSNYDVIDGQFYWGTHFINNQLNLTLATDGITQNELDSFLYWFAPGKMRELILAEHPNRAIMARISDTPQLSVLPFEQKTKVKIQNIEYETSTTLYKGNINLTFVMDEPFWYSKTNLLGRVPIDGESNEAGWVDVWTNAIGEEVNIYGDTDALKIIMEDGIPVQEMLQIPILLGNDIIANPDFSITGPLSMENQQQDLSGSLRVGSIAVAAVDEGNDFPNGALGYVGPRIETIEGGSQLTPDSSLYLYYPGTAPAKPTIQFTFSPTLTENAPYYINSPKNSFTNNLYTYNYISLVSSTEKYFYFSIPGAYVGYNQAIRIFDQVDSNTSLVEVRNLIRDNVKHKYAREWAIAVVDSLSLTYETMSNEAKTQAYNNMQYFIRPIGSNNEFLSSTVIFNSKNGRAIGQIGYRKIENNIPSNFENWGILTIIEEDVGDMIKSDYLIIEDRNFPNEQGQIIAYTDTNEITKAYSHLIKTDISLSNFFITYKYMYY